jgi:uncharacterized protein (TIGR02677 family)
VDSIRAVAYANYPNVALHRAVMRALLDNRARGAKLRLSLTEIAAAVERAGVEATADQVAGSLRELEALKVVDSMQSFERVRTAAELRLNHFSYDVTGLGERIEQFFDELAGLVEAVGSLDANRLARIRALLARLIEHRSLDPRELQSTFTELHAQFEDLRAGAAQFMRELSATMASTEAIDEATFADYKRKVADYLSGFWRELGQHADAIAGHVAALDAEREPVLHAVASLSVAPHPSLSEAEVLERQVAILRRQWAEISAWFGAGDSQLRSLDTHLHAAIDWILRGVRRLRERRVQRVNRSSEYRALAALFANASSEEDCHAIFAAAFGLHGARHMSVPELDPDVVSPGESWWDAPFAPVTGFLRRPGRGEVAAGRPAPIADAAQAQEMAVEEELRRRSLVGELLDRLPADPARLSELPALDEESFDLLLDALGMAVATGAVGYSDDGTLRLTVLDMGEALPPALVQVGGGGVLESPDLLVQVGRA